MAGADAPLRVICGPTGAGKSALVHALAREMPLLVISADSRQVYRGFDVGTAKPTREEQREVSYRGIDLCEPTERFSASRWAAAAEEWLDEARASGRVPVIVGGTGFYVRALVTPLAPMPPLDPGRRSALERWLAGMPLAELRRWTRMLDPDRADLGPVQLRRAIEVALLGGERISALHGRQRGGGARGGRAARYLVVDPGAALHDRIAARAHGLLHDGWPREVASLARTVPSAAPAWNATGYRAVLQFVHGRSSLEEVERSVIVETRQYAKRQRTWIRHQLDAAAVTTVDPTSADALDRARRWLAEVA